MVTFLIIITCKGHLFYDKPVLESSDLHISVLSCKILTIPANYHNEFYTILQQLSHSIKLN
ncbi:hypothetical protein CVS40_12327 [Lucilia cuprina]|nr:hypothetical protein CVS40_12327 [Lucilia cuprina]